MCSLPLRSWQTVDRLFVGVRGLILEKRLHLRRSRRQAGEIQRQPAQQPLAIRLRRQLRPSCSSRSRIKRSIGVRARSACFTLGSSGRTVGRRPSGRRTARRPPIHRFNTAFCAALNGFFNEGGGIISSGSSTEPDASTRCPPACPAPRFPELLRVRPAAAWPCVC